MGELKLLFILQCDTLYFVSGSTVAEFALGHYGFDIQLPISSGKHGNHLFNKTGPLKAIRAAVKATLSRRQRFFFNLNLLKTSGTFISDRPLNNIGIKHFCDLLEQENCRTVIVYYDDRLLRCDLQYYLDHFIHDIPAEKIIGEAGPAAYSYIYAIKDDSVARDSEKQ